MGGSEACLGQDAVSAGWPEWRTRLSTAGDATGVRFEGVAQGLVVLDTDGRRLLVYDGRYGQ